MKRSITDCNITASVQWYVSAGRERKPLQLGNIAVSFPRPSAGLCVRQHDDLLLALDVCRLDQNRSR